MGDTKKSNETVTFPLPTEYLHKLIFGDSSNQTQLMFSEGVTVVVNEAYETGKFAGARKRYNEDDYIKECKRLLTKSHLNLYLMHYNVFKSVLNVVGVGYDAGYEYGKKFESPSKMWAHEVVERIDQEKKARMSAYEKLKKTRG